jgi:TrmH family RNA methyltransferase
MITSIQNPKIKLIQDLIRSRKVREELHLYVAEGVRLSEETIRHGRTPELILWSKQLSSRGRDLIAKMISQDVVVEEISNDLMQRISDTEFSQGILLVMSAKPLAIPQQVNLLLALDDLRDPGNLGTILRTSASFGVQGVILLGNCTDPFAPKVVRAAMGAHFYLPIMTTNYHEFHNLCQHILQPRLQITLADVHGDTPCWQANFENPLALVVGGEAEGISSELIEVADFRVIIPMPGGGESLNAAIASSILLYEIIRQRQK